jgi:hypothetical protein
VSTLHWVCNGENPDSRIGLGSTGQANLTPVPIPEPGSLLLLGTGLVGIARYARRRRTQTKS